MKKVISSILAAVLITGTLTACSGSSSSSNANEKSSDNNGLYQKTELKMDTTIDLRAIGPKAKTAVDEAMKRLDEIDQEASPNNEKSDVWKINNAAGKDYVKVGPDTIKMIKTSIQYAKLSGGAFDISVGPLIKLWGIGTEGARVPSDAEIKAVLPLVGYDKISINEKDSSVKLEKAGMSIDLGGIAKGFAADEVIKIYKKYQITDGLINLGGSSIYAMGKNQSGSQWTIGIQHPRLDRNEGLLGKIKLSNEALSTSGDYERYFIKDGKRYHHIIDPHTGYPTDNGSMSDTIVIKGDVPDANMIGDLLTTTVFVSGVDKGLKLMETLNGMDCAITTTDNKVYATSGMKKRIVDLYSDFKEVE
jgi:thiamine biosynthesis lipoprotein